MMFRIHTVQYHCHIGEALFLVQRLNLRQLTTIQLTGTCNKDCQVGNAIDNGSIGNDTHRHIVYDNVVVTATQFLYQIVQALVHEQFGRIGSNRTCRQDVQILMVAGRIDNIIYADGGIGKVVGQTRLVLSEVAAQGSLTDIHINKEYALLHIGKAHGQVA